MLVDSNGNSIELLLETIGTRVIIPQEWSETFFLETGPLQTAYDDRRRFVRHRYRSPAIMDLGQTLPAVKRRTGRHVVYTCDIARSGFGLLHFEQLFPGERMKLWLPTQSFLLQVTRCRRLGEKCYLVGAEPSNDEEMV